MAPHGLILSQDEATSLRNLSKYLPGLRDIILRLKMAAEVQKYQNTINYIIFTYGVGGMGAALFYKDGYILWSLFQQRGAQPQMNLCRTL